MFACIVTPTFVVSFHRTKCYYNVCTVVLNRCFQLVQEVELRVFDDHAATTTGLLCRLSAVVCIFTCFQLGSHDLPSTEVEVSY